MQKCLLTHGKGWSNEKCIPKSGRKTYLLWGQHQDASWQMSCANAHLITRANGVIKWWILWTRWWISGFRIRRKISRIAEFFFFSKRFCTAQINLVWSVAPFGLGDLFVVTAIRLPAVARIMQIISEDTNKRHVATVQPYQTWTDYLLGAQTKYRSTFRSLLVLLAWLVKSQKQRGI